MAFQRGWLAVVGLALAVVSSPAATITNDAANILHVARPFRAELAASVPAVLNPAAIAFDEFNRMYVLEQSGRIRLLSDTNATGVYKTVTDFSDMVSSPTALICANGGVFVAARDQVYFLQDTNGDGVADIDRIALNAPAASAGKPIRDLVWRADCRIVAVGAGFSFDPRTLQVWPEMTVGERSLGLDEQGRAIFCAENQPFRTAMYEPRYATRNTFVSSPAPLRNLLGLENTLHVTGSCLVYRSNLPTNYFRGLLIADPERNSIHALALRYQDVDILAEKGQTDLITSDDPEFSPAQIMAGPCGIYIVDAQAGRNQQGRIWRIVPENAPRLLPTQLGGATTYELAANLAATDSWRRDTASRLLCERRDRSSVALLLSMLHYAKIPEGRLYALQTLANLGAVTEDHLVVAFQDSDARVRARAVLLSEKFIKNRTVSPQLFHWLAVSAQDPSEWVRYQLAFTLGEINSPEKSSLLAAIFKKDPTDLWMQNAVLSSLNDGGGEFFAQLASDPAFSLTPAGAEFLRKMLNLVGVQNQSADVGRTLQYIENTQKPGQLSYVWLTDLALGLRQGGSSLAGADPDGRLLPYYRGAFDIGCSDIADEDSRVTGLRLFEVANYPILDAADFLMNLVVPTEPISVQIGCVRSLARYNNGHVAELLLERRPALAPVVRGEMVAALLTRTNNASTLLSAVEYGNVLHPADFSSNQKNYLRTYGDSTIEHRAADIFGGRDTNGPERMKQFAPALSLAGSVERGHALFDARCIACHSNGKFGPVLAYRERPNREKLLSDIVDPSAEISPGYSTYIVDLGTGEKLPGLMADPGAAMALLREPDGTEILLPRAGRPFVARQTWSLMPEEVVYGLNPQDMADLIDYVSSLRVPNVQ